MPRKKKASEIFHQVDPDLKVIDGGIRRRYRQTIENWDGAAGVNCPTCGREIFRVHGPLRQCLRCLYKEVGIWIEEVECGKCKSRAALITTLLDGLMDKKVICSNCRSYRP